MGSYQFDMDPFAIVQSRGFHALKFEYIYWDWYKTLSMQIGIIGINHKVADLQARERLVRAAEARFGSPSPLFPQVLLSTCNRTEIYFSGENLSEKHSLILNALKKELGETKEFLEQKLYSFFGTDCLRHLFRVVSGLDSAILFETEIQGQVKAAYEKALCSCPLPQELHFLFQKGLKAGKMIRSRFGNTRGMPKLEEAIFEEGRKFFSSPDHVKVLFVGASEINEKIIAYLTKRGISNIALTNRTNRRGEEVSTRLKITHLPFEKLNAWPEYDWIIFGTKAKAPLLTKNHVPEHLSGKKLIMDLSVPRNVDPTIAPNPCFNLWNIDRLMKALKKKERAHEKLIATQELLIEAQSALQTSLYFKRSMRQLVVQPLAI